MKKIKVLVVAVVMAVMMTISVYANDNITLTLSTNDGTRPTLSWEFDGTVDIMRAEVPSTEFNVIGTSSDMTYVDETAIPGREYVYKLRGFIDTEEVYSNEVQIFYKLETPQIVSSNNADSGKPVVKWDAVNGADKYEIYRATSENGPFKKMYTQKSNVYTNTNSKVGNLYYYKVKAICDYNNEANSDFSNIVKRTCDLPCPDVTATNVASTGKVKLNWTAVKNASEYKIYRAKTKDGTYSRMLTTSKTSYTNTSAVSCQKYYYKVTAVYKANTNANSAYSEIVERTCDLPRPDVKMSSSSKAKPKLLWKSVPNADKYYIYRASTKDGSYKKIYTATKNSFTNTSASTGKTYYYKVKAASNQSTAATSAYSLPDSRYVFDVNKKMVALTFDDGPSSYTESIVNCLKKNNSYATFFVVGNRVSAYSSALKKAYDNGNEIGNHTYSHPMLTGVSTSGIKSQISKTDNAVKKITGETTKIMRPPGGDFNSRVKSAVGKPLIYWSIDTLDWKTRSKTATINSVMNNVRDGSIVLMHDIHYPTKEAALELIPKLKKKGYQIVTVSDLAKYKGYTLKNGTVYYSFK